MDKSKLNVRTRRVVDYAAMNGSDDDSDDDFINRNSKVPTTAKTQKPPKISKLKLGGRKAENNGSSKKDSSFTKVKPIIEQSQTTELVAASVLEAVESISDLSVAEPDLIAHSICSQDTVIISSCECVSSQESTDFSDFSSTASSTINLLTLEELSRSTEAPVIINSQPLLKENTDRVAKKRIIDETLNVNKNVKKTKIEKKEQKLKKECSPKTANVHLLPPVVSPCMVVMDKLPDKIHSELATPTKVEQVKENSPLPEIAEVKTEMKNQPKATRKDERRKVYNKKPVDSKEPDQKGKLKTRLATKSEFVGKSTDEPPVKNYGKIDQNLETLPEKKNDHNNFKSPMSPPPIAKKLANTKTPAWNPPGKASGSTMTSTGNSPAIGLRLGLSRKRLAKPLHPDVKVKI